MKYKLYGSIILDIEKDIDVDNELSDEEKNAIIDDMYIEIADRVAFLEHAEAIDSDLRFKKV